MLKQTCNFICSTPLYVLNLRICSSDRRLKSQEILNFKGVPLKMIILHLVSGGDI